MTAIQSYLNTLNEAWRLRYNRRNEECYLKLVAIKQAISFPAGSVSPEMLTRCAQEVGTEVAIQIVLLEASLARAHGKMILAHDLVLMAEEFAFGKPETVTLFALPFEKSLNAFAAGDYPMALDGFLRAAAIAGQGGGTDDLRLAARLNALLCMDHLGVDCDNLLGEIRSDLESLRNCTGSASDAVETHLRELEMRWAFREGRLSNVFDGSGTSVGQAGYLKTWIAQLPYHRYTERASVLLQEFLLSSGAIHQRGYRARTLQGLMHPEDAFSGDKPTIGLSDAVDRLYLWVWKWLVSPSFPIEKVVAHLTRSQILSKADLLTIEDRQMARNALLWLSVFDPVSEGGIQECLQSLSEGNPKQAPILSMEFMLVHWILAVRDGKMHIAADYLEGLKAHPLWANRDIHFREIAEAIDDPSVDSKKALANLIINLRSVCRSEDESDKQQDSRLLVNLGNFEITDEQNRNEVKIVSQSLALAFDLLNRKGTVSCEDFAAYCFGISRFDSLVHMTKIFNLLSRMRKITREKPAFKVKSGYVVADGSWMGIHFKRETTASVNLRVQPQWKELVAKGFRQPTQVRPAGRQAQGQGQVLKQVKPVMSRQEIEALIGRPRSTTNRIISGWLKERLIERENKGRATLYRLNQKAMSKLMQEDLR